MRLIYAILLLAEPHATSLAQERSWPEEDLLIVQLQWRQYLLSEDLLVGVKADTYYLPLGPLFQALELPIEVHLSEGLFEGSLVPDLRLVRGDVSSGLVQVAGTPVPFTREDLIWCQDGIYAAADWLSTWLPVDFEIDTYQSVIRILPREPLPLQRRLERLARREAIVSEPVAYRASAPVEADPYRFVDWPLLDVTFGTSYQQTAAPHLLPSLVIGGVGDLGWMTGEFLFSTSTTGAKTGKLDAAHLLLSRKDHGAGLLGPLHATQVSVGDVFSPPRSFAGRSSQGLGFSFSNAPIQRPHEFDRTDLHGQLLPGWEVELYRDGALEDYRLNDGSDTYLFRDVPLYIGRNLFTLVFNGPQGQERTSTQTFQVDGALTRPGDTYYYVAANCLDEGTFTSNETTGRPPNPRYFVDLEHGINSHLSVRAHVTHIFVGDAWHLYAGGGLRTAYRGHVLTGNLVRDQGRGQLFDFQIQTHWGRQRINAQHLQLADFISDLFTEYGLARRSDLRIQGPLFRRKRLSFAQALTFQHRSFRSGKDEFQVANQVTLTHPKFALSQNLNWFHTAEDDRVPQAGLTGRLLANTRGKRMAWQLRASYELDPSVSLREAALAASYQAGKKFRLRAQLSQDFDLLRQAQLKGSLSRAFRNVSASTELGYSDRQGLNINLTLSAQLMRHPTSHHWSMPTERLSTEPPVLARTFIDENQNGHFDAGEQHIAKARFTIDGVQVKAETDDRGEALLPGIPLYRPFDVSLNQESIGDPFLVTAQPARGGIGRPGRLCIFDFPLVTSGEIEGHVVKLMAIGDRGVGGAIVRLWDEAKTLVAETKTEYDGFFLFEKMLPGPYLLTLDPEQIRLNGLHVPDSQRTRVQPSEAEVSRVVFQLVALNPTEKKQAPLPIPQK